MIIVIVSTLNNYGKEVQFRKLMELREDREVTLKRDGDIKGQSVWDIMVGDILFVRQGDRVPVDCVLISGYQLLANESSLTGEAKEIEKAPLQVDSSNPAATNESANTVNPFLLSGSIISEGQGEAIVCAVGDNTRMGRIHASLEEADEPTPLQIKLESTTLSMLFT